MFRLEMQLPSWGEEDSGRESVPMRINAFFDSDDSPAPIFVMHRGVDAVEIGDRFSCVASIKQLDDLPMNAPLSGSPFYRVSSLFVVLGSHTHAMEFWEKIQRVVQYLADNIAAAQTLENGQTVVITPNPTLL